MLAQPSEVNGVSEVSIGIKYLREGYPKLRPMLDTVGPVELPKPKPVHLPEAVVTIITGQMLSNAAASAIVNRLFQASSDCGAEELFAIPEENLLKCGLSRRKVKSIKEFGAVYCKEPDRYREWPALSYEDLREEVCRHWGLSDWTAEMLAIFHFGHEDVFPTADGTIKRAVSLVRLHLDPDFSPDNARPHRTALARALWASVDKGYWKTFDAA
ncbi:DNA-3-methyladenine glycosylase 2 family protein [Ruegeria pomeroyi]|nr:DNA-3-methyladenine glycosylase 2 family protein [Ruegeria pomeroyi]